MERGMIHLYCGDGKGKTTAAMGLAVRFAGCGYPVVVAQFQKTVPSGECGLIDGVPGVTLLRLDSDIKGFSWEFTEEERTRRTAEHAALFARAVAACPEGKCLLVLDEMVSALNTGLMDREPVLAFLREKPQEMEVVLTGRDPEPALCALADYITEMRMVKHPMQQGVMARRGVEF